MKIAVAHNLRRGGAHRRLTQQYHLLEGELREFTLSSAAPVSSDPVVVRYAPTAPGLPLWLRPPARYRDASLLQRAWVQLADEIAAFQPDVIYANPCGVLPGAPQLPRLSVPIAYYCDEPRRVDYEVEAQSSVNDRTRRLYASLHRSQRQADRAALARVRLIMTNSTYSQRSIQRAYQRDAVVVGCGVSPAFHMNARPQRPLAQHVLSVGTLIPSKRHDAVLEAVARAGLTLPVVVVALADNQEERSRLNEIAHREGLVLRFELNITDDRLRILYQTALATVYLATREPLGLASLEAQACGCPVIVADDGGLPETMIDGETGWAVPAHDAVPAAAERLRQLWSSDSSSLDRMSARAFTHGQEQTWSKSTARVNQLLHQLAG